MEDFKLTKKPDLDIFDRRFPAMFDDPIYDPTKMTIIQGTDGILDDLFSYQVYNKLKNHWRLDVEPTDKQPGMIWSDTDDDKLKHYGDVGGEAWDEVLQLTRSFDVSPQFASVRLMDLTPDFYLDLVCNENLTGNKSLALVVGDAARTITLSGNPTLGNWFNQSVKTTASPTFVTAKLTNLTDGYVPYHVTDAAGLADSPIRISGVNVGIGVVPGKKFHVLTNVANDQAITGAITATVGTCYAGLFTVSGACTTNYGGHFTASGAGTNWGIYVAAGHAYFAGNITMASATSTITGGTKLSIEAGVTGIHSTTIYNDDTALAANVVISAAHKFYRSTAGNRKYKDNIKDLELDTSGIYELRPISFTSKCKDDDKKKRFIGLIADEVDLIYPSMVECNDKGEKETIDYRAIQMAMLKEIQNLNGRISQLEN